MSEEKSPFWRESSFKPGNTAGAGGKGQRTRDVTQLARRYTVDSIRALVEVARLPAQTHATPKIAAASKLLEIGYPGLFKGATAAGETDAGRLHLLALQAMAPEGTVAPVAVEAVGADGEPVLDAEALITGTDYSLLPDPDNTEPGEALPLWDVWKARKRMAGARDAELTEETQQGSEDNATDSQ